MRDKNTEAHWPDKITAKEFLLALCDDMENFEINLSDLEFNCIKKYPEDWMKLLVNWMELN